MINTEISSSVPSEIIGSLVVSAIVRVPIIKITS